MRCFLDSKVAFSLAAGLRFINPFGKMDELRDGVVLVLDLDLHTVFVALHFIFNMLKGLIFRP